MKKTIENALKKNHIAITVALAMYPTWVACDFASTRGISLTEKEIRENIEDYNQSGRLYQVFRIGHYIGLNK